MDYLTVEKSASYEFTEKKSRFIGYITPCKSEAEAIEFINSIKKKHSDARHNVYAYILRENNKQRYSDDGEPKGTGGLPVLEVLSKKGITDACVVITRYFGGILLGTGGLTRAYSEGCKGAVEKAGTVIMTKCKVFKIICDYGYYNTLQSILSKFDYGIIESGFDELVSLNCYIKLDEYDEFLKEINEKFSGKIKPDILGESFFGFDKK